MKLFALGLGFFMAIASLAAPRKNESAGVFVLDLKGHPLIERHQAKGDNVSKVALKKKEKIRGQALIQTDAKSELLLELSPGTELKIYPDSEVLFPLIQWESGATDEILLKRGQVRWKASVGHSILIKTDLLETKMTEGVFVLIYNPKTPQVQMMALQGEADFLEKNGEDPVHLTAGKKVHFLGQVEDGEIAYDVLLQGRKIPKGQKSQVEELSAEDHKQFSIEAEKKAEDLAKKKAKFQGSKSSRKNEICKSPGGLFNECRWVCENNPKEQSRCRLDLPKVRCVRSRCNANGEWAENYPLDRASGERLCKPFPVVQPCDY